MVKMKSALAALAVLIMSAVPAAAGQGGIAGYVHQAGQQAIVWGGVGWLSPGANAHPYPIRIYGPPGNSLLATINTTESYFQLPMRVFSAPGSVYWNTQAPADGLTDGPSITVQASPPVGAYWPPGYTPLPPHTGPSPADKDQYVADSAGLALTAAAVCFLIVAAVPSAVVTAASLIVGGLLILSFGFQTLAADPPDPHFDELASIASQTPRMPVPAGAPQCNAVVLSSEADYIGLVRTMVVTANRISGAAAAHNSTWVTKQNAWYLHLRSLLPNAQATFEVDLRRWLTACAPRHTAPTQAAVLSAERNWLAHGFQKPLADAFTQLGVSGYDAEQALIPASPAAVVGAIQGGLR